MSFDAARKKMKKSRTVITKAQEEMDKIRDEMRYKIGKLADDCSLLDIDISEKDLKKEFMNIFSKYQKITKKNTDQ